MTKDSKKPTILLIGTGGVGTIVAYGIDYVGRSDLSVVVRRDFTKVKESGWEINSPSYGGQIKSWKPNHIFASIEDASASGKVFDYVILTTKNLPDVVKPEELVEPVITPEITTIVLIQNGFDIGRPFVKKYPKNICISGVSHIGSHNHEGVITHTQKDKALISYFENPLISKDVLEAKSKEFISLYSNKCNDITYFPDAKWYRYRKLVYNATLNTVCTLTGVDTGRLFLAGTLESVSIPAMREVIKIAKADGVELPEDVINSVVHSDDGDWFKPSMLVDAQKGNPIEMQAILGNLLTVASELKVEAPVLSVIYNLLEAVQFRLKEGRGLIKVPEKRPVSGKLFK